jgi:hypothetical protein
MRDLTPAREFDPAQVWVPDSPGFTWRRFKEIMNV